MRRARSTARCCVSREGCSDSSCVDQALASRRRHASTGSSHEGQLTPHPELVEGCASVSASTPSAWTMGANTDICAMPVGPSVRPPSTTSAWPVTKLDAVAGQIERGLGDVARRGRRAGWAANAWWLPRWRRCASRRAGSARRRRCAKMLVAIRPGQMQLTRMFSGAELRAPSRGSCARSRPWRWNRGSGRSPPECPATEAVEMIEPPPCARIKGTAYFIPNSAARTCRCMTASKPSAVTPSAGSRAPPVPALLKRTSSRPKCFVAARDRGLDVLLHASRRSAHSATRALVVLLDPRALVVLDVGGDDAGALGHEQIDRAAPDAAGGARDDRDLSVQTSACMSPS